MKGRGRSPWAVVTFALLGTACLASCDTSSGPSAVRSPSPSISTPSPDPATQRYVALVRSYWSEIVSADVRVNGGNLAAKVCLGVPTPGSPSNLQLVDPHACGARAQAFLAAQQKFLTAMGTTAAPPQYAADDQVFRAQIPKAIADVKADLRLRQR
jgi:hypothetical protein